jgi:hypothetical protein
MANYNRVIWFEYLAASLAFVVIITLFEHATRDSFTRIGYELMHSHDGSVQV